MLKLWKKNNFNLIFAGLIAAAVITSLASWHYLAELSTHLMIQYAIGSLLLFTAYIFLPAKPWKIALAGILVLYFGAQVAVILLPRHVTRTENYEDISILQFNVNYANAHMDKVSGWINNYSTIDGKVEELTKNSQPDIVVLQEVSPDVAAKLGALDKTYPYKFLAPKPAAFGMAIFSKIPFKQKKRQFLPDSWNEYTEIIFTTPLKKIPFTLTELHTIPPMDDGKAQMRNKQLDDIAVIITNQMGQYKILMGDFNITPYSPYFRKLQKSTGLTSVMQGKSITGTWPSFYLGIMRIPIDHMLDSDTIEPLSREVQPDMDSDHLPVLTKLRLYKAE